MNANFNPIHQSIQNNQKNYGNHILLFPNSFGQPRFMLGPHYYLFLTFFTLGLGANIYIDILFYSAIPFPFFIVICITSSGFALSYLNIGFSLPGIASQQYQPQQQQVRQSNRYCKQCKILRPLKTNHCPDCDVCIQQYDHHCPWIGKCVGKGNLCAFYTFLVLTFGNLLIMLIAIVTLKK